MWETSAEIPYWWRLKTQIWVALLIGCTWREIGFNQSEALPRSGKGSDTSSVWNFRSTSFREETTGDVAKSQPFSDLTLTNCSCKLSFHSRIFYAHYWQMAPWLLSLALHPVIPWVRLILRFLRWSWRLPQPWIWGNPWFAWQQETRKTNTAAKRNAHEHKI